MYETFETKQAAIAAAKRVAASGKGPALVVVDRNTKSPLHRVVPWSAPLTRWEGPVSDDETGQVAAYDARGKHPYAA